MSSNFTKARQSLKVDFNKYIRLRDTKGQSCQCISCRKRVSYGTQDCQAGHYYSGISIYRAVEFNEVNVNVQCFQCNYPKEGNKENYRVGLLKKYGKKVVEKLDLQAHNESKLDAALCFILKKQYIKKWEELEREYLPKFKL